MSQNKVVVLTCPVEVQLIIKKHYTTMTNFYLSVMKRLEGQLQESEGRFHPVFGAFGLRCQLGYCSNLLN